MKKILIKQRRLNSLLLLLCIACCTTQLYAQVTIPKPQVCITPPSGFESGGAFFSAATNCSSVDDPNVAVKVINFTDPGIGAFNSVKYVFGVTENTDITDANLNSVDGVFGGRSFTATDVLEPGVHWVMQIGEAASGKEYVYCQTVEIIRTDLPVANAYTCNGTSVHINIEDNPENRHNKYKVNWGDGTEDIIEINASNPLPFTDEHAYSSNLSLVTITGLYFRFGRQVCSTTPVVTSPFATPAPILNSLNIMDSESEIGFKGHSADKVYTMQTAEDNSNNYEWEDHGIAENGLYTASNFENGGEYCFRLSFIDQCSNPVYSNVICGIDISATQASSSNADISWNMPTSPSGTPQQLVLERDVIDCDNCLNILPTTSNDDIFYEDNTLDCDKIYTYQINTSFIIQINGEQEIIEINSKQLEVNPLNGNLKLTPNGLINASFPINNDDLIKLIIHDNSDVTTYHYFHKGVNDIDFLSIGNGLNSFDDISIKTTSGAYCYKYQVEDACEIKSDLSPEFCTVFLSYAGNTLNWTDYSFPYTVLTSTKAEYTIEVYNNNIGAFLPAYKTDDLKYGVGQLISASETPTLKFRILAQQFVDLEGFSNFSIPSYSNTVTMPVPADVFIPSAFSPNNDGDNDTFEIKSKFVNNGNITIYDRWGSVLYDGSLSGKGWNGSHASNSEQAPNGNYTYRVKGVSESGDEFSRNGIVTLLR